MVLFDPIMDGPFRYVDQFRKRIGGAESNVAIGLSRLGHNVSWMSKLGNDELGRYVLSFVRGEGVDTSRVLFSGDAPTGVYIKERVREGQTQVYYYRKGSAASQLTVDDIDWDHVKQAKILHLTGITSFLSDNCWEVVQKFIAFAKQEGIMITFDPNIRTKLWGNHDEAKRRLLQLSEQSDVLLAGLDEAQMLLGIDDHNEILDYFLDKDVTSVILKDGANGISYASKSGERGFVPSYKVDRVVDPVGAGDGFAVGILSSLIDGKSLEEAVQIGAVIGAMVVSTYGDIEGLPDRQSIEYYLHGKRDVIR
jgi:2-dehydro-3-deoxygluconokinase